MKAIIWIIVLALIAWGIWWFVKKDDATPLGANDSNAAEVQGAADANVDLGEFDSKG